jgi:diadenosine tetraphosphate (Ap4A) HIT family hydrolase
MKPSCVICDRFSSPDNPLLVLRTPNAVLYHMPGVDLPGYLVLAPARHVEHIGALDDAELGDLARIQARAVRAILSVPGVRKVYALSFGEALPHLHIHLFPRTQAMIGDPEFATDGFPDGPRLFNHWRRQLAVPAEPDAVMDLVVTFRTILSSP